MFLTGNIYFFVSLTYKIYQTLIHTLQNPYPWPGVRVWRVRVGVQLKYPRVTCDNLYMVTQVVPKAKWLWEQDTQRHLKDTLVRVGVLVGLMGHWFTGDSVIQNQALNYLCEWGNNILEPIVSPHNKSITKHLSKCKQRHLKLYGS